MGREWLFEYDSVNKWASRIKLQSSHKSTLDHFIQWYRENGGSSDLTPDDLIEMQKSLDNSEKYKILDKIQEWITTLRNRQGTKRVKYSQLRSFFAHNRAELPRDPGFRPKSETPSVVGDLSPEEIKRVLMSSNKLYRALFLCMFQGALDSEMFVYWNENGWDSLHEQLKEERDPIKIALPGRKINRNIKPYYTFITTDAINAVREYLDNVRPRIVKRLKKKQAEKGEVYEDPGYIFLNQAGTGVSKVTLRTYFRRHLKKLGMIEEYDTGDPQIQVRYGKNPHEMRDTWRTLWSKSPAKYEVGEFFMGHSIDSLGYDKAYRDESFYKNEYLKATPFLNLLS
ncbi:hypothetical protein GF326_00055, partial [Candidatus Bathyarchaeota archaeon]|nr:hypothetical protein [Candidatus Bathyarchaeota archaeon]